MAIQRVLFQGEEYLLINDGAIAKREEFERFGPSYAYLYGARIIRYDNVIGHRSDLTFLGETKADIQNADGIYAPAWDGPGRTPGTSAAITECLTGIPMEAIRESLTTTEGANQ